MRISNAIAALLVSESGHFHLRDRMPDSNLTGEQVLPYETCSIPD
jgi:hypothetical protein